MKFHIEDLQQPKNSYFERIYGLRKKIKETSANTYIES